MGQNELTGSLDLRGTKDARHHLRQEIAERRRPERGQHVAAVAGVETVGSTHVCQGRGIEAERHGQQVAIGSGIAVQRLLSLYRETRLEIGILAREERTRVRGVVRGSALRDEREAVRIMVIVEQCGEELRTARGSRIAAIARTRFGSQTVDEQAIESRCALLGGQRDLECHASRERLVEINQPFHARIDG